MKKQKSDNQFATKGDLKEVKEDINGLKGDVKDLKEDMKEMKSDIKELLEAIQIFSGNVDKRFEKVEKDVTQIKSTMVTKDYLDEKLGDLRGDLTVLIRKEDNKVKALVKVLVEKKVLNKTDQKKIYSLEPFAQI